MARVLIPAHAQRQEVLGAFASVVRANVAAAAPGMRAPVVLSKPAMSIRGAMMTAVAQTQRPLMPPVTLPRSVLLRRWGRWGLRGLGDTDPIPTTEPVALPASQPTPDTSSFDWGKLVSSIAPVVGQVGTSLIQRHYAPSPQAPAPQVVFAPGAQSSSGVSTKTLVIGGVAVVGVIALMFMMRK